MFDGFRGETELQFMRFARQLAGGERQRLHKPRCNALWRECMYVKTKGL